MNHLRLRFLGSLRLLGAAALIVAALSLSPSPAHAASSGDTGMGYSWVDNQGGSPSIVFDWVDVAAAAPKLTHVSNCDDCVQLDVEIGFNFPFFGAPYPKLNIGANGSVMFINTTTQWGPNEIPSTFFGSPVMLPFWSDWDPGSRGDVYAGPVDWAGANGHAAFAIEWKGVENWDCSSGATPGTWEVILIADGSFVFQYLKAKLGDKFCDGAAEVGGGDMTVAIQGTSSCYVTYANQESVIPDKTAIRWTPQQDACSGVAPTETPTRTPVPTNTPEPSATAGVGTPTVAPATPGSGTLGAERAPDRAQSTAPQKRDRLGNLGSGPQQGRGGGGAVTLAVAKAAASTLAAAVAGALAATAAGALVVSSGRVRRWLPRRPGGGGPRGRA
jgi:hypothetical protein